MPKDSPKNESEDQTAKDPWWIDFSLKAIRGLLVLFLFWLLKPYLGVIGAVLLISVVCLPSYILFDMYVYPGKRLRRR